jgi:hypothetical protein
LKRLDLYKFDGSPMNPMFLAYNPPQMLPTITMNPTDTPPSPTGKVKRGEEHMELPLVRISGTGDPPSKHVASVPILDILRIVTSKGFHIFRNNYLTLELSLCRQSLTPELE